MVTQARGLSALRTYLDMIKFEHSIFALPFAMIGMMWAASTSSGTTWPGLSKFLLICLAMVTARSAAMAYNRIADRDIDALNPRTRMRAIPAGLLQLRQVNLFFFASCALFLVAAGLLNFLTLILSPAALVVILGYSKTKRFTPLCHFVLGLSLGIAPAAAWIGVRGNLDWRIVPITIAVIFWTAGFDIIYALQDVSFDREHHLRSLPETVGLRKALWISRACHVLAVGGLALGGFLSHAGPYWYCGVAFAAALLSYEQSLVSPKDQSKVNLAFFTLNGFVSIGVFIFALLDQLSR